MSVSTSKGIQGGEENSGDENIHEESIRFPSSQDTLGNGDTEIFSTLIPLMKNLNVLKTCRLVCKSWNQFACQAMRKWGRYFFQESYPESVDYCLNLIEENKNLRLPTPFGNITILANSFREKSFLGFLKYVRDSVNNYSIELRIYTEDENLADPVELQTVLTSNLHNFKITKLDLAGKIIGDGPGYEIFQPEKIRLPHLKSLAIGDDVFLSDKIVILCENLCHFSPLTSIVIGEFTSGEKLKKVMSPGGMKSIEKFSLDCVDPISLEDWKHICARIKEIPCIKSLKTHFAPSFFMNGSYYEEFKSIVEHFADSLEILKGDWLPVIKNKCFPKLRQINDSKFCDYESDFSFPVGKYPLLKKATFGNPMGNFLQYMCVEEESPGIEDLSFEAPSVHYPDLILKFVCLAGMIFPNVSTFKLVQYGGLQFTQAMLSMICKSFPKLTALELRVNLLKDDGTLSGLRIIVDEWLEEGWPWEKIPREASLLDFQGLEKLTLGPFVVITKHLFVYCLSKIPKLQYLTFHLNGGVSAVEARDSVGHLKRVTVWIGLESIRPEKHWVEEMERLQVMLPSVVEIKT